MKKDEFARVAARGRVLSPAEALTFFEDVQEWDDLATEFPQGGCSARAHLICRAAEDAGIHGFKVWTPWRSFPHVKLPALGEVEWPVYHVAAVLPVAERDATTPLVYDPAVFDAPVTTHQWSHELHIDEAQAHITRFGDDSPYGGAGGYHYVGRKEIRNPDSRSEEVLQTVRLFYRNRFPENLKRIASAWRASL